jgi:hypothetical protein
MSVARLHLTLVTLGVQDLARATAFYEGLGLKRAGFASDKVAFFDIGGLALALYPREALAADAGLAPAGSGFRAITLAWNLSSREAVDAAMARAGEIGASVVKPAQDVFWGGYSGHVADPDGHLWAIALNPIWPLRGNGALELPPPADIQETDHG